MDVKSILPFIIIALAFILAISPSILLADQGPQVSDVSKDDLSKQQIEAIIELQPAVTSADVSNGATALRDVVLMDDGSILVAGSFVDEIRIANNSLNSYGSRDIFVGQLAITGEWTWVTSGGGSGIDEVVSLEVLPDHIEVVGWGFGNLSFGNQSASMTTTYGQDAWRSDLTSTGDWSGSWRIDPILLPQSSSSLWCGFR
ncbi:MAG: hypothetical protein H8D82_01235 [Euryarchaeota archaeon]|nr:hypothetical protein [Euryarchaeota archaeon]